LKPPQGPIVAPQTPGPQVGEQLASSEDEKRIEVEQKLKEAMVSAWPERAHGI